MCHKMFQKGILLLLGVLIKFSRTESECVYTKLRPKKEVESLVQCGVP